MEDIHRLENTGDDHTADPTFEIAFMLPLPGQDRAGHKTMAGSSPNKPDKKDSSTGGTVSSSDSYSDSYSSARDVILETDSAKKQGSGGEATEGVVETRQEKPGLLANLDYEHVASTDVLGSGDSLSVLATFGMEGKYFNPRVQRSEHFLEPWR